MWQPWFRCDLLGSGHESRNRRRLYDRHARKIRRASASSVPCSARVSDTPYLKSDEGQSLFSPSLRLKPSLATPSLVMPCHERRPKVPVGPRPWTLPRGLDRPLYAYEALLRSSCYRVNARFGCNLPGCKPLTHSGILVWGGARRIV
jgi:hypothetical protein